MGALLERIARGDVDSAIGELDAIKCATQHTAGVDYARAVAFLHKQDPFAARQALLEELRFNSQHDDARELLASVEHRVGRFLDVPDDVAAKEPEFSMLYNGLRGDSMLTWQRLFALYDAARAACRNDVAGDFVECGVAGGGSTVLVAATLALHDPSGRRRVVACDTFSGMPTPTSADRLKSDGVDAEATHWGTGTCASPAAHVEGLAGRFGVSVRTVVGLFETTLPSLDVRDVALLHIDADWYASTKQCLDMLGGKVVPRGSMQIDDYGYWAGCAKAVDEFVVASNVWRVQPIDGIAVKLVR